MGHDKPIVQPVERFEPGLSRRCTHPVQGKEHVRIEDDVGCREDRRRVSSDGWVRE
jgi:hypothetical protein